MDNVLREKANILNPGATADLTAATVLLALIETSS